MTTKPTEADAHSYPALGLDLGTTFSAVAYQKPGCGLTVVEMLDRSRSLPTIVSITGEHEFSIGDPRPGFATKFPSKVVTDTKRLIGRRFDDPEIIKDSGHWNFGVVAGREGRALVKVGNCSYSPESLLSEVAKQLVARAQQLMGSSSAATGKVKQRAVICVPANFDKLQRKAMEDVADLASIKVLDVINEPTAAALACVGQVDKLSMPNGKTRVVAVFDYGGGTFDVSVVRVRNTNQFRVMTTGGDPHLGGRDIDMALVEWAAATFEAQLLEDLPDEEIKWKDEMVKARSLEKLRSACEMAKKELATADSVQIFVSEYWLDVQNYVELDLTLNLDTFNEIIKPFVERTIAITRLTFDDARRLLDKDEPITNVFLVGGSSHIKLVEQRMREEFGPFGVVAAEDRELVVAKGAAIWAANYGTYSMELLDVVVQNIGIETADGSYAIVLYKDTLLPAEDFCFCTNERPSENTIEIRVFEGNHKKAEFNRAIGSVDMTFDPDAKDDSGHCVVKVTLQCGFNGELRVEAVEEKSGKRVVADLKITLDATKRAYPQLSAEEIEEKMARTKSLHQYLVDLEGIQQKLDVMFKKRRIGNDSYQDWCDSVVRAMCYVSQQQKCDQNVVESARRIEIIRREMLARFCNFDEDTTMN